MTTLAYCGIFFGQLLHSILRTAAIQAISADKKFLVIMLNMAANIVRVLVLSGGIASAFQSDWIGVALMAIGQSIGDYLSMTFGPKSNKTTGD